MTTIAHKPLSPQEEKQGQLEWLESLRDELDKGNLKEVRDSITSAIKLLEREIL